MHIVTAHKVRPLPPILCPKTLIPAIRQAIATNNFFEYRIKSIHANKYRVDPETCKVVIDRYNKMPVDMQNYLLQQYGHAPGRFIKGVLNASSE